MNFTLLVKGQQSLINLFAEPNPFEYRTEISYVISEPTINLTASIFAINGKKVATFEDCPKKLGLNNFTLDLVNFAKGTYFLIFDGITNKNERFKQVLKVIKEK